jgi:FkbM family methyltransferase
MFSARSKSVNPFISFAQNYEDVILWRALKDIENGFFVDCGAYDPSCHSVTKAFYDRGWSGINIEPIPSLAQKFADQRPLDINLNIAVSDNSNCADLYEIVDTGLSTLSEEIARRHVEAGFSAKRIKVQTTSLSKVLEQFSRDTIHFLKIDVEGAEKRVLAGLDLGRFRPWIILVEATRPASAEPNYEEWEPYLLSGGYDFVYFDGLNRFYVSHDHPELRSLLALPPNVFDNFIQVEGRYELERAQNELVVLKNSASWRLTAPLREGNRVFQALLHSVRAGFALRFHTWSNGYSEPTATGELAENAGNLARPV